MLLTTLLVWLSTMIMSRAASGIERCYPGMDCFPSNHAFYKLSDTLTGEILFPNDPTYDNLVLMKNTRTTKFPAGIALVRNTDDIQKCVIFARKYKLRVTVQSSGHDYNGRSTAHGSFQIYLGNLKKTEVDLDSDQHQDGVMTCESGTTLMHAYTEVQLSYAKSNCENYVGSSDNCYVFFRDVCAAQR